MPISKEDHAQLVVLWNRADEYTMTLRFGPLPPTAPKPGDKMPDGTICAGRSPENGKMMYTTPVDEPLTCTFKQAAEQAAALSMTDAFGHHDWHVPMKAELNVMFNNRAVIGGFDESGSNPSGWYLSAPSPDDKPLKNTGTKVPWVQRFSDGVQTFEPGTTPVALRCIRYG
jgi:hypothetical protein